MSSFNVEKKKCVNFNTILCVLEKNNKEIYRAHFLS